MSPTARYCERVVYRDNYEFQDAIFLLYVCDDILLPAIHPARHHQHQKPQRVVHGFHLA